ncbi:MAG: serine/threonine protein kinase, partial [Proteobacteria bacterium]|nr:serine/threonine protein kinase [Pseudomonadota bacterium]
MNTPSEIPTPKRLEYLYAYERLLGEGTNGKTYLARDLNTGEQVAIKALKLNQSENFKSFELFKREAETLSSLNVTGVPHFYQSILSDTIGGECYIIQEYVNAPSIQSYLAQGYIFTESETLTLMYKVASILSILHTQYSPPIIHRDIKPSNVMCQRPENGNWTTSPLYLIDFGAVANAHSNSDKSTIAGTVGYMAPEQNFGECLPQTDLYALGATALHMLTGVPPYDMDFDTYSLKYQDALDAHAPDVSAGMRELLGKLLSYSFDQRPASAIELLRMIENVQAGKAPNDDTAALQSATTPFLARLAIWFRQKIFKRVNTKASVFFNTLDAFEALPREKKPTMTDQIGL